MTATQPTRYGARVRFASLLLVLLVLGCFAPVPDQAGAGGQGGSASFPMCPFTPASGLTWDKNDPYPFCQWEGADGYQRFCPSTEGAHGYMNWHTANATGALCPNDSSCNTCLCFQRCRMTEQPGGTCLAPSSGTAAARCTADGNSNGGTRGTCYLFCDNGETCPDGMRCVPMAPEQNDGAAGHRVCAWAVGNQRCALP